MTEEEAQVFDKTTKKKNNPNRTIFLKENKR